MTALRAAAALCALALLLPAVGGATPSRSLVVAVEIADGPAAPDPDRILLYWLGELERADSGLPPVEVQVGSVLRSGVLERSGVDARAWLERARASDADWAALARVGHSGGRYSLDVELRGTARPDAAPRTRFLLVAEGSEGLDGALELAAHRVRAAIAGLSAVPGDALAQADAPLLPADPGEPVDVHEGDAPAEPDDDATGEAEAAPPDAARLPAGSPVVSAVEVSGNRRIESDAIKAVLSTKPGGPLLAHRVSRDVRRIYQLGFFRDVQVLADETLDGIRLTFAVEEHPIIRRISLSGNENVDEEDIREKLTLTVGSTIDYPLLLENREMVQAIYQTKGYYLADVKYEVEELGQGIVGVVFDVTEGEKLRLRKIEFSGNENVDAGDLIGVMQTKPWRWYSHVSRFWDHSGLYAEPIFLGDLDRVSRLYMDRGFIRVAVGKPEVEIADGGIKVSVGIVEGDQFKVGRIDVLGDETMDRDQLVRRVALQPEAVFNRSMLSDDVERLQGYYQDRGFFDAQVSPRTHVKNEDLSVDVTFEVAKNELFFVDSIEVNGNTRTRDGIIRRELGLAEGELYSGYALRRSERRVQRLGFFEEVEVEPRRIGDGNRVALDVDVVERPTGSFSFGAGVGSTDGFVITASIRQDNLFGLGRAVNASADLGSRNSRVFLSFVEPYIFGTAASFSTTLSSLEREFIDFDEQISALQLLVEYPLDEGDTTTGAGYSFSSREVAEFDDFRAASLVQREDFQGDVTSSKIVLSLRRDTRDDIRFPRRGHRTGVSMEFAGLGGLTEFVRLEIGTTHWIPLRRWLGFESTFVLNTHAGWAVPFNDISDFDLPACTGDAGDPSTCLGLISSSPDIAALDQIDDDLELPLTERYFLGGLGSFQLRGYKQRAVGPRRSVLDQRRFANGERAFFPDFFDPDAGSCIAGASCNRLADTDDDDFEDLDDTDIIGGNKFFLLNLELQFPISEELGLRGLAFLDMGNAFAENDSIDPGAFRFGTGAGVQWFSPFGPITIILGVPINKLEDEDASVFEFSMGGSSF